MRGTSAPSLHRPHNLPSSLLPPDRRPRIPIQTRQERQISEVNLWSGKPSVSSGGEGFEPLAGRTALGCKTVRPSVESKAKA